MGVHQKPLGRIESACGAVPLTSNSIAFPTSKHRGTDSVTTERTLYSAKRIPVKHYLLQARLAGNKFFN